MSASLTAQTDALITDRMCRVTLALKVRITEITLEKLRSSIYWDEEHQESSLRLAERQNLLLQALLNNEEAVRQFLAYVVMTDLRIRLNADLSVKADVKDEDEILMSVISNVSDDKAAFLATAAADGSLFDETELFHRCFTVEWDDSILSEIEILPGEMTEEGNT